MRACPQPIIAAVDGVCAGAGAILAMSSDIRLSTPRSKTAFLFTRVGLAGCDMGACAILPRIIGHGRAAELLLSGRSMGADEALACGFYSRLLPAEELPAAATQLAQELADGPTFAHGMTKTMLNQEWNMGLEQALEAEAQAQAICMQTEDFRRAYAGVFGQTTPGFQRQLAMSQPAMSTKTLQPAEWARPKGYANGMAARGQMIFISGQIGWDADGQFNSDNLTGASEANAAQHRAHSRGRPCGAAAPGPIDLVRVEPRCLSSRGARNRRRVPGNHGQALSLPCRLWKCGDWSKRAHWWKSRQRP